MARLELRGNGAHARQRVLLKGRGRDELAHRLEELQHMGAVRRLQGEILNHDALEGIEHLGRLVRVLGEPALAILLPLFGRAAHHVVEERPRRG